ncbi:MAG: beta-galactosidase [Prevotella sp.]|nr:beta-galactosidase [Prevotella sp.]
MKHRTILALLLAIATTTANAQQIAQQTMQQIYEEVRTPYKYGMVVAPQDNYHKIDCPTVFREGGRWLMTYVVYNGKDGLDGRGYETWLASSDDLLTWHTEGRLLSYRDEGWDMNQRGGFPALIDWDWGGEYRINRYKGRYWMTYIGGAGTGYEAVRQPLHIGLAWTRGNAGEAHEWQSQEDKPLLSIHDKDVQWWEQLTQYKSTVYQLPKGSPALGNGRGGEAARFLMFYNAGGINPANNLKAERIGIATSKDMRHWERYAHNPVYAHEAPGIITGDAQLARMDSLYVMFYFSAYSPDRPYNAYNTFSVSRDLIHWQDWTGADLIWPSKPYDEMFAHKSYVLKYDGVVYHFYCAVNNAGQRGIAVATSRPMGRSAVSFPEPETKGRRTVTSLNHNWQATLVCRDSVATNNNQVATNSNQAAADKQAAASINLPHNFDDYYGYRQLRHGNLHGSAVYTKTFEAEKQEGRRYFLQLEGVGTYATITLNGTTYPRELIGRTVFTLDVTDALRDGNNDLSILVDHPAMQTESPWVCGGCSSEWGFSEGSQPFGIFRPVSLIETADIRIEPFGVHIWNNAQCDSIFIETEVKNYSQQPQQIELVSKLAMASGKTALRLLTSNIQLAAGETRVVRMASPIANPTLWSTQHPYLYTLTSLVKHGGKVYDEQQTPFGIRSISWPSTINHSASTNHQFLLNGKPTFINGTCEYEHLLGASHAFTPEQIRSRVKQIRNAGFNAFREAHQPHNLLYQQLLDEQGILFWSQFSAHIWYDTPQFRENFKRLLVRWVKERRNSPSVILWGLQNESVLPKDFAEECTALIRSLDPTCGPMRVVTTCNGGEGTDWNVIQNWSGTYGGSADNYDQELSRPEQLLNGEYGAWRTIGYDEASFTALLEKKARLAEQARDSVCGHFQWIFASHDNPGRVQPDGGYRRIDKIGPINYKGLLTIWEQPTEAYHMYRHRYAAKDTVIPTAADRNTDLLKGADGWNYLYRINCGGDCYTDEFGQQWHQDNATLSHSWGQDFGLNPYLASQSVIAEPRISGTRDAELFRHFRYGRHRLWYDFAVPDGRYRIELYLAEPWIGRGGGETDDYEGIRIFDIAVNDSVVVDDLDPWAEAGYCGAMRRIVYAEARNGQLRISFPEVKAGQAIISAIAIATQQPVAARPHLCPQSGFTWQALDADTIAKLPKAELPKETDARPATKYQPTKPGQWTIKPGLGQEYALRFRYKNTSGAAVKARLTITDSKRTVLVDRDITFPTTPNKFKTLSTTTGTQINAGTYTVRIDTRDVAFDELEIQ